jgi:hypothetical protein
VGVDDRVRNTNAGQMLAIPHGGNLSNGFMFDDITLRMKRPIERAYAIQRMQWEPFYEVTQMKVDAETASAALYPSNFSGLYGRLHAIGMTAYPGATG